MRNLQKIFDAIYDLLGSNKVVKATSIGTHGDTILVSVGKRIFEITVKELDQKGN